MVFFNCLLTWVISSYYCQMRTNHFILSYFLFLDFGPSKEFPHCIEFLEKTTPKIKCNKMKWSAHKAFYLNFVMGRILSKKQIEEFLNYFKVNCWFLWLIPYSFNSNYLSNMSSHSSNERHCSLCHIVTKYRKESQKIIENAKINCSLNKQVSFTSTPICETPQGKEFYRSNNVRPLALGNQLFFAKN